MKEITELDMNKYLVMKWKDIEELKLSNYLDAVNFAKALHKRVMGKRKEDGKQEQEYLVLNLDDDISYTYLCEKLFKGGYMDETIKVKDIAIDLVNAILKAKGE